MTLDELTAALERIGDGDWQILDILPAEEAEGSGHSTVGPASPEGRRGPTTSPRRPVRPLRKTADRVVLNIWLRIG